MQRMGLTETNLWDSMNQSTYYKTMKALDKVKEKKKHLKKEQLERLDGGRHKDKTVIHYLQGIYYSKLFHLDARLLTDLIWSSVIATWLQIKLKAVDDNIYRKRKKNCSFQRLPAGAKSVQSKMLRLQPEWQTPSHHIKSGLFTCQAEHIYWQHNFSLSASRCSLQLRNSTHR